MKHVTTALTALAILVLSAAPAAASPRPTASQIQHRIAVLRAQQDQVTQEYDQARQQFTAARRQLHAANRLLAATQREYRTQRARLAQIAAAAYENHGLSPAGALLSSDSAAVLRQSGTLTYLSSSQSAQLRQTAMAARALTEARTRARRTADAVAQMALSLSARQRAIRVSVAKQEALLATLTSGQQAAALGVTLGGGTYAGTTGTQAGKALAFAYAQLGCPYVWGGTGPCSSGFDCSGLVQGAYAAAGIAIPRTTWAQWAALPHIPLSQLRPGDLLYFSAEDHVGIYAGGGYLIDAPQPGMNVEKVSFSGWYRANFDGAARP